MPLQVGSVLDGVVTAVTNFGAFVELPGGVTGLVHISEIAESYVRDVRDFLKANDRVRVKVISVDPKGKIGLSIRQAVSPGPGGGRRRPSPNFEDRLARFIKESDEHQQVLRRNTDAKRGGRGTRRGP
ncbi:MAG: S1 RNA-binding domain-containing protein [Peptococcaceae bacterium]|jgi:S1 RNA binding domain protein|nr:S1 RNA-binding domain-containing protein [Peptococcaceae bacterium]